ncbi:hypothetical protein D3C87_1751410 [compost metagenome]
MCEFSLKRRFVAFRVQRRLPALGRGQHDVGAGVLKRVVRRGQLFEPEASFAAGIAKLIVRGQNDEDFHGDAPVDE